MTATIAVSYSRLKECLDWMDEAEVTLVSACPSVSHVDRESGRVVVMQFRLFFRGRDVDCFGVEDQFEEDVVAEEEE